MNDQVKIACSLVALLIMQPPSWAQHSDVLNQDLDERLASGSANFDTGVWTLGARSYTRDFDSDFAINNPGWNALGTGSPDMPAGAAALPINTDLEWDFLPMKIDGTAANLFYWNGTGSVAFGSLPTADYELFLQAKSMNFIPVDGSPTLVPGEVIDDTDSIGTLHRHRFWFLDDGDSDLGTDPADGIYLISLRTRMDGLDRSEPIYFLFGTPGSSATALDDAQQWVDLRLDELTPDFAADFDGNLAVDDIDFAIWEQHLGLQGSSTLQLNGDANFDDAVEGFDFLAWQRQFGSNLTSFAGASSSPASAVTVVPEPSTICLIAVCLLHGIICARWLESSLF